MPRSTCPSPGAMSVGKKRSGFQITSVTNDYQPSSPEELHLPTLSPNGPRSPPPSRFRVVRLDHDPMGGGRRYQRGRWTCVDFYHPEVGGQQRAGAGHSLDSGLSRATPIRSPHLLPPGAGGKAQQVPRSQGAPVLGVTTEKGTGAQLSPPPEPTSPPPSPAPALRSDSRPGRPVSDVFSERLILARSVFGLGEESDHDSGSSNSLIAIDNKIEQAMDLVKTHLLFAVREEVEILNEQIKDLTERNSLLEHENSLLRSLSTPQQLSEMQSRIQASRKGL
ncbi:TSC22 domain family protein 4 [Spea bombifrons]|uniref:TSC22 domain family protein 4 n=1 Tax=Spea bombifrons TaxID=233779 RepID=UPI002349C3DA|nr:TSC22 domain family protein 4 [Spea bombifrons]